MNTNQSEYKPISQEFEKAFDSHGAGCRRMCACGNICFDSDPSSGWTWDDGEFEQLEMNSKLFPSTFIPFPHPVGCVVVGGKEFVIGCPCNGARPYQDFIDLHAEQIAEYLNARAKVLREHADKIETKTS